VSTGFTPTGCRTQPSVARKASLSLFEIEDDRFGTAKSLNNLGLVLERRGDVASARQLWRRGLTVIAELARLDAGDALMDLERPTGGRWIATGREEPLSSLRAMLNRNLVRVRGLGPGT
jgi:hypothetical protein